MSEQLSLLAAPPQIPAKPTWDPAGERYACFRLFYDNWGSWIPLPVVKREVSTGKYTQRVSAVRKWIHGFGADIHWNKSYDDPAYKMDYLTRRV